MRHLLMIAVLLIAAPARAGEGAAAGDPQFVDLSPVAVPIIAGGRIHNYVFVSLRLDLAAGIDAKTWRDKEPFFRDALVRIAHRTSFGLPGDWSKIDQPALKRVMAVEVQKIAGAGVVTAVEITSVAPQRRIGVPPAGR
jgi:hypothetical protein